MLRFTSIQLGAKLPELIGFFLCGMMNNFAYSVMLSAASDMMKGLLPASVVLLADILPCLIVQATAPWYMNRIPYAIRIILIVSLAIGGFLIPALFSSIGLKLLGVVFASISSGLGEITFLAYSAKFHKNTVSAFSSGTGAAGVLGAVSYLALSYAFTSEQRLLYFSPLPLIMAISFFFLMRTPSITVETSIITNETAPLIPDEKERLISDEKETITQTIIVEEVTPIPEPAMTLRHKAKLMVRLLPYMLPLAAVYFGEYLINQGVSPLLVYPRDPAFAGREYTYYQALYQVGVFISRSSVNFVPLRNIWVPAVLQLVNAAFLSFVAVYDFIPSIYIVFVIVVWEGLLGGAIYVNAFYLISQKFFGAEKEYSMGAVSMSYASSITAAAGVGILWEPMLCNLRSRHFNGNVTCKLSY
eukprot:TRINITY_DN4173_c0_g1_i1.p1 TRINITY_DN4173_c0_g1~~TRINITY_DN4173_c0_g1_i1.p1  ORF type:complete len:416 (+),score=75.44 TRINITY_DN4173_c0_g1_i1:38-1285(+)